MHQKREIDFLIEREDGAIIKWAEDIIFYDPATLERKILISTAEITPGAGKSTDN